MIAIRNRTSGPLQALYVLELARRFIWSDCQDSLTDEELQDLDVKLEELDEYLDGCAEISELVNASGGKIGSA